MTQDGKFGTATNTIAADSRTEHRGPEPSSFRVRAYPTLWRLAAAALTFAAGASMPVILTAVLLSSDPPITPPVLWRMFAYLTLVPALGAWLVGRALTSEAEAHSEHLVLQRRGRRIEIPGEAIAGVSPWAVPLPGVGITLRLRSGRRFAYGLCGDDVCALLRALAERTGVTVAAAAAQHPLLVYAEARRSTARWRWIHLLLKFPLFALLPTMVLFNAHQYIAYGGTLGQYYLVGLGPYLRTFAEYWITVVIYLVLYAAVWRGAAEALAIAAAFVGPSKAVAVRRIVEVACRALYYGGVPVLLGLRFLE